jgi:hypothetical protein
MQGMGILFRVHEPFWTLTLPPGVERNPLNYFCAPNQATPDYVASYSIKDFIAYGFLCCFDAVDPDNFAMWNMVQREDVQWLRECFLRVLEKLVLNFYAGLVTPETKEADFDSDWAESLIVGDEGDDEALMIQWAPGPCDDHALSLVLSYSLLKGEGHGGDDEVIWFTFDALKDRAAVKAVIEQARKVNALALGDHLLESERAEMIVARPSDDDTE